MRARQGGARGAAINCAYVTRAGSYDESGREKETAHNLRAIAMLVEKKGLYAAQ